MKEKGISTPAAVVISVVITAIVVGSVVYVATPTEEEAPKPTVTITSLWTSGEEKTFKKVLSHVENDTGIETEHHPRDTDPLKSGTLMDYEAGVATADIVVMPWPARITSDAEAEHLEPVGDLWDPADFVASPSSVTVGGKVYAAPFKVDIKPGFWYRKSFFEDHGLSVPETYDEFLTLLDDISKIDGVDAPIASGDGVGWPLSDLTEAFIMRQTDGAKLQKDLISGDADFTDSRVKTAFEEIRDLHEKGYFSTTREFGMQYEYWWDGSIPLYFMGSWTPSMEAVKDPGDCGVFRLPGTKGGVGSVNWFTIPKYSEHKEAAKTVLKEIISKEGQEIWTSEGGFIATNKGVSADAYKIKVMADISELAGEITVVPDLDDSLGSPFQSEFWSQLKGFWSDPAGTDIDGMLSTLDSKQDESLAG